MGVVISKTELSPLSLVSILIGFISFAFTLGTFLKVVWINLETLGEAPHEVHSYLTNLRTEILEERANLKVMRKNNRRHHRLIEKGSRGVRVDTGVELDEVTLKTMSDTIRHLCRKFRDIEKPFLEEGEAGIEGASDHRKRRRVNSRSLSPYYQHSAYASPPEKAGARGRSNHDRDRDKDEEDDDDKFWAQRTRYAKYGLKRRIKWLYLKPTAQQLFQDLSRVQIRRIARQVGGITVLTHEYGRPILEIEDMMRRQEERMGRFVGVRRVEGSDQ